MVKKMFVIVLTVIAGMTMQLSQAAAEGQNYKIKRLVNQLYDKTKAMDAERYLSSYGIEVTEYVLPVLKDKSNENVRIAGLRVIAATGDTSAEDAVVALLSDRDHRVRQEAARTLSVIGRKESSIAPLKKLLSDQDPNVRYNAVKALAGMAPEGETGLFISALGDYDPRVRTYAVYALGQIKSADAVPYLSQMVRDYDPGVRIGLVKALAKIDTEGCLEPLVWLIGDPDENVRLLAVEKLGVIKSPGADEQLALAAGNTDPRVTRQALLGLLERNSPRALEIAREHLDDEHMDVKLAAIEVVGKMGGAGEKSLLEPLMQAESTLVRQKAKEALNTLNEGA
ncbi:MAG: HEAT repeat domain-containing protein [Candidatus Omnitrophota bacterium]